MNRLIASVAAITALAIAPAAVAVDAALPQYRVTVSAAAPATSAPSLSPSPSTSGNDGSSGSSSDPGSSDGQSPGSGFWGESGSSTATTSGTQIASSPGVVMIDTVVSGGEGAGTGIVLRSDGIVLTNYHVVEGSTQIRVVAGSANYTATVIGYDASNDIAVLKLADASGLTTASLDTATAVVGDKVTAIGQGGGQGVLYTTSGSITALDQQITASDSSSGSNSETLTGLIQTNAQIVPGYSGGPLLDSDGEVIGIDTAASSTTPISGYAIPISSAMTIANKITSGDESGSIHIGKRAALGVEISSGSSGYGYGNGYGRGQQSSGLTVMNVLSGGAAEAAGMTAGSTITSIGGTSITDASTLTDTLDQYSPGDRVSVGWTDASGQAHQATVTLATATTN